MKQCLRVLDRIQPATRAEWKTACYEDECYHSPNRHHWEAELRALGAATGLLVDMDWHIQQCVQFGCAVPEHGSEPTDAGTLFRLIALYERACAEYDKMRLRSEAKKNETQESTDVELVVDTDKGKWEFVPQRPPVYVVTAPACITADYKAHLLNMIEVLGGGYLITDTTTIEVY